LRGHPMRPLAPVSPESFNPSRRSSADAYVIGGRTKNDLEESRARHQLEMATPRVMFESWDSWLRKHVPVRKDS
jgi:hypothetical protein